MVRSERYVLPHLLVFPKAFFGGVLKFFVEHSTVRQPVSYSATHYVGSALLSCHDDSSNVEIECPGKQKTPVPVGTGV